ncbi:MAG: hypothetical protein ACTS9Y_04590 [Methylophilus sp.]|uniref:hypothetical protein n=1 Tax=Methylophilus sp. TaxID=29541 RepID=UPI003F9F906A
MTNQANTTNINIADQQRNANRDYYEFNLASSMRVYMSTRSDDDLDRIAATNQRMFKYRFGLTANATVRSKIIAIKRRYNLTDPEVRALVGSGQISVKQHEVFATPDRVSPVLGFVFFVIVSFICGLNIFSISIAQTSPWTVFIALGMIFSVWGLCIYYTKKFMVAPWRILERSGILKDIPNSSILDSLLMRSFIVDMSYNTHNQN